MSVNIIRKQKNTFFFVSLVSLLWGCSAASRKSRTPEPPAETVIIGSAAHPDTAPDDHSETKPTTRNSRAATENQSENEESKVYRLLDGINDRLQSLEIQLATLNDRVETQSHASASQKAGIPAKQTGKDGKKAIIKPALKTSSIITHPGDDAGELVNVGEAPEDPEVGFVNDDAVQIFRKSMIVFQSQKYSEAILAFSNFLEAYPDHALAGSAQFYIGESYLKQKEYKLALKELYRVLTSYDRSVHISDTLKDIASAEDTLKNQGEAAKHRQLLTSLFPQSPAASALGKETSHQTEENQPVSLSESAHSRPAEPPLALGRQPTAEKVISSESDSDNSNEVPPTAPLADKESSEEKP